MTNLEKVAKDRDLAIALEIIVEGLDGMEA